MFSFDEIGQYALVYPLYKLLSATIVQERDRPCPCRSQMNWKIIITVIPRVTHNDPTQYLVSVW